MKICNTIRDIRTASRAARRTGMRLGLVPTMGALHEGHLSLIRAAKASCQVVVASIFVNPTQFGPNEDLARYPRPFERDRELLENEGVDLLFAPSVDEMYPSGAVTWVTAEELSAKLDGRSRPGHFRGVTTIVAKLFHAVEPDAAMLRQLRLALSHVRALSGSAEAIPLPDGSVDAVLAGNAMRAIARFGNRVAAAAG